MTNTTPWQTMINTNNTSKAVTENNLIAVKKSAASSKNLLAVATKAVIMPRRYSFDDNGGSYLGL